MDIQIRSSKDVTVDTCNLDTDLIRKENLELNRKLFTKLEGALIGILNRITTLHELSQIRKILYDNATLKSKK